MVINNSNKLNISYNNIIHTCGKTGIYLSSGNNNTIARNSISSRGSSLIECWGIAINYSKDNHLIDNKVTHSDANKSGIYHYVLGYKNLNNTIEISDLNENYEDKSKDVFVKLGLYGCIYPWDHRGFQQHIPDDGCARIPEDGDPDPHRWIY
jgi:hypothetical protein